MAEKTTLQQLSIKENGYPAFDDLMDNFYEEKDLLEIQKFSSEARRSLLNGIKLRGKKTSK